MPSVRPHTGSLPYLPRVVDAELTLLLSQLPAVWIDGPKGVGKTATAGQRAATARHLDRPEVHALVRADLQAGISGPAPVLLDEWQLVPEVWDAVRRAVDDDPAPNRFILTGSATDSGTRTHSGAGRIVSRRMRPMTLPERGISTPTVSLRAMLEIGSSTPVAGTSEMRLADYASEILRSGFPGLRHLDGRALTTQLDGYLARVVESDMAEAGLRVRRPDTLTNWLRAYAAATSTTASWEKIRAAAHPGHAEKPARSTTVPYIEALTRIRILDGIEAWSPTGNRFARLAASPKHHLADPALAARLLGVSNRDLMQGSRGLEALPSDGPFLGALFESLCALTVRVFAQAAFADVRHFREYSGRHEVDFIVLRDDGKVIAVESKIAASVDDGDVKHLHWLESQMPGQVIDKVILTTGPTAYRRTDGVAVVPLALLGP